MTELRCPDCEALMERIDECYECLLAQSSANKSGTYVRTKCKHGHPWTEENTVLKLHRGTHVRECRTCHIEQARKFYRSKGHLIKKEKYAKSKQR
jgi:hypothetical protein